MELSEVEKKLQKHDDAIKRLVEELRGIKNALVETELDDIESEGDGEYEEKNRPQNRGGRGSWGNTGQRRGFAAMDPEKRSEIARKGGAASHGGQGKGRSSGEKELEVMERFLDEHFNELNDRGRKEVEDAIEKKRDELEVRH